MKKKILYFLLTMTITTSTINIPANAELKHTIEVEQYNTTNIVASVPNDFNKKIVIYIKKPDGVDSAIELTPDNQYIYKDKIPIGQTAIEDIKVKENSNKDDSNKINSTKDNSNDNYTIHYSGDISATKDKQGNLKIEVVSQKNEKDQETDTDKEQTIEQVTDDKPSIVQEDSSQDENEQKSNDKATTDNNKLHEKIKSLIIDGIVLLGLSVAYLFVKYKKSKGDM